MAAITVTSTATPLLLGAIEPAATAAELAAERNLHGSLPGMVVVSNIGATTIYLGATASVTAATGAPVLAGQEFTAALPAGREVYAITASGSSDTRVVVL